MAAKHFFLIHRVEMPCGHQAFVVYHFSQKPLVISKHFLQILSQLNTLQPLEVFFSISFVWKVLVNIK